MKIFLRFSFLSSLLLTGCATGDTAAVSSQEIPAPRAAQEKREPQPQPEDHADALSEDADLDDLLRYAAEHSPEMRAAFEEWRAAVQRAPQARALSDPTLRYSRALHDMQLRQSVMLSQKFPWFGKRELRGGIAEERAHAAEERFEAERLEVMEAVTTAYAEYAYVLEAIEVLREVHDIARQFEDVARARFRAGEVGSADALRAEIEAERLGDDLRTTEERREPAAAELNAALGRREGAPLPQLRLEREPDLQEDYQTLEARLMESPAWRAARREVAAAEKEVRLARRENFPDVTLGAEVMDHPWLSGAPVTVTASINLPIWREKYAAQTREAQASRRSAEARRESVERELEADLRMAFFGVRDAERKIRLHGDSLRPLARQTYDSLAAGYRSGDADFLDLIDAQQMVLDHELLHRRALADHLQNLAELDRVVGGGLLAGREQQETTPND